MPSQIKLVSRHLENDVYQIHSCGSWNHMSNSLLYLQFPFWRCIIFCHHFFYFFPPYNLSPLTLPSSILCMQICYILHCVHGQPAYHIILTKKLTSTGSQRKKKSFQKKREEKACRCKKTYVSAYVL